MEKETRWNSGAPMTEAERQKLCDWLRHLPAYLSEDGMRAAEEIERLAKTNERLSSALYAAGVSWEIVEAISRADAQSDAEPHDVREALENAIRASRLPEHKETDAEFMRGSLRLANEYARIALAALVQSDAEPDDPLPRKHQDPSKWPTRETVERAHALAQSDAEPHEEIVKVEPREFVTDVKILSTEREMTNGTTAQSNAAAHVQHLRKRIRELEAEKRAFYTAPPRPDKAAWLANEAADRGGPADYIPIGGAGNGA